MKIRSAAKLTDLKWLNLFDVDYLDKDGHPRSWQVASRSKAPKCVTGKYNMPDAVVVVPFHTAEHKIVVIKEYRVALEAGDYTLTEGTLTFSSGDTRETFQVPVFNDLGVEFDETSNRIFGNEHAGLAHEADATTAPVL